MEDRLRSIYAKIAGREDERRILRTMSFTTMAALEDESKEKAEKVMALFEGMAEYRNYVTKEEAQEAVGRMTNWDGSKGVLWPSEEMKEWMEKEGVEKHEKPYYNFWALYLAVNMVLSDQGEVLKEYAEDEEERMGLAVKLARTHLKDKDKPLWIRWYFGL
jgi:hypothetical protein